MKLQKFEQSGFILETDTGYRLAFDIGNKTPLEKLESTPLVDAFIVSHIHGDHFHPENIKKLSPTQILIPRECSTMLNESGLAIHAEQIITHGDFVFENDSVKISFFNVDHGPNISAPIENLGFLIHVDGQTVYFAGDMYYPSGMDVSGLSVDHVLLPVGGHYTFGPQEALDFAQTFKSIGTIIPMHYEKNNFIDPVRYDEFVGLAAGIFTVHENS